MSSQLPKSEGNESNEKVFSDVVTKPDHRQYDTSKPTTGTSETLLGLSVYDLTAEDKSFVQMRQPTHQHAAQATAGHATKEQATKGRQIQGQPTQATQESANREQAQATREIEDVNNQGREIVTRQAGSEHINENLPWQGYSPKENKMLPREGGAAQCSSRDIRQLTIDEDALDHYSISSAQSSNGAVRPSTDTTSYALQTCWKSDGTSPAKTLSSPNTSLQDDPKAADSHGSAHEDRGIPPKPATDTAHWTLPDDWEGEIIREEIDGYLVAWKSSYIPKEYADEAMIQAWEERRRTCGKKQKRSRQLATIKGRVEKSGAGK